MSEQIVVAGAGHAAGQVVATLKQKKFDGRIIVIGDEAYLPYQRPPLSKKFLAGEMPAERLYFKPESFYDDPNIEFRLGTTVASIDREKHAVTTDGGDTVPYDKLILAIGSRVRTVPAPGEPGDETWGGVPFEQRIHVGTWMPPSYDPQLRLIYQGTSVTSPAPKFLLGGTYYTHLYHNSTLALDVDTGEISNQRVVIDARRIGQGSVAHRIVDDTLDLVSRIPKIFKGFRNRPVDDLEVAATGQLLEFDQREVRLDTRGVAVHDQTDGTGWRDHSGLRVAITPLLTQFQRVVPSQFC